MNLLVRSTTIQHSYTVMVNKDYVNITGPMNTWKCCKYMIVASQLSSLEVDTAARVQILNEAVCVSHSANTLGKSMNPTILPTAMGK